MDTICSDISDGRETIGPAVCAYSFVVAFCMLHPLLMGMVYAMFCSSATLFVASCTFCSLSEPYVLICLLFYATQKKCPAKLAGFPGVGSRELAQLLWRVNGILLPEGA